MSKIFLSYAHEDAEMARQIALELQSAGVETWFDELNLHAGDAILQELAKALAEVDFVAVLLSRTALTKRWVSTEMTIALTSEIERGRPRVILLRLDNCEMPAETRHKMYIDFRERFAQAMAELKTNLAASPRAVLTSRQTAIATLIENADSDLWTILTNNLQREFTRPDIANLVRELRSNELEALVAISNKWKVSEYKWFEDDLIQLIKSAAATGDSGASRVFHSLCNYGFFERADDLDYTRQPSQGWCANEILRVANRIFRQSGVFRVLPPPLPERLSALLSYPRRLSYIGNEWFADRYPEPAVTKLSSGEFGAIVSSSSPAATWLFRCSNGNAIRFDRKISKFELSPQENSKSRADCELCLVPFRFSTFNDLEASTEVRNEPTETKR